MVKHRTLAALAYICWVPALYIVLSEKRQEEFVGFHGGQALVLWTLIFIVFFALRALVNLIWRFYYIPYLDVVEVIFASGAYGYALSCGFRCLQGLTFRLPE